MKEKAQVIFDINNEKFKYLYRDENITKRRVDMVELNQRLNENKKSKFYSNTKIIFFSLLFLGLFALIVLKF
jgi:hypothetical protein|tara:strand:+ start:1171 stop:1386 length:216 start_codon:yes stop_codon:yes gene_type:complete